MATVLIVEDDASTSEAMSRYLGAAGYSAICETDGRSALKRLLRTDPDVVVLDLGLPVMDGTAFLKVMRSYVRFRLIPIFVVTGKELTEFQEQEFVILRVARVFKKGRYEFAELKTAIDAALPAN